MPKDFTPWPCAELSQYPLDSHWTDVFPASNLPKLHYENIKQMVRSLFQTPAMAKTYAQLRNYAFQQGAYSNANRMDLEFFYNILTHDYPFFVGDKQNEIQSSFSLNTKKYKGMPWLKCSHFDIYRVEQAAFGLAQLQSLTNDSKVNAYISLFGGPHKDDIIFARTLPIGIMPQSFAISVVEPWDTISPDYIDNILSTYQRQYIAFCDKFPNTSHKAFCKIAAYHIYELLQAYELRPILNQKLAHIPDIISARTYAFTFHHKKEMIRLPDIPEAKEVDKDSKDAPSLVTVPICKDKSVPQTLREAIISSENKTIEITVFMKTAGEEFIEKTFKPLIEKYKTIQSIHILDDNEMYRSLRHLSL
jgi:hypothetical protein